MCKIQSCVARTPMCATFVYLGSLLLAMRNALHEYGLKNEFEVDKKWMGILKMMENKSYRKP